MEGEISGGGRGSSKGSCGGAAPWVMAKLYRSHPTQAQDRGGACAQTLKHWRRLPPRRPVRCCRAGRGSGGFTCSFWASLPLPSSHRGWVLGHRGIILIHRGDRSYQVKTQLQFLCPVISGGFNFNSWPHLIPLTPTSAAGIAALPERELEVILWGDEEGRRG